MSQKKDLGVSSQEYEDAVNLEKLYSLLSSSPRCADCRKKKPTHADCNSNKLICQSCARGKDNCKVVGVDRINSSEVRRLEKNSKTSHDKTLHSPHREKHHTRRVRSSSIHSDTEYESEDQSEPRRSYNTSRSRRNVGHSRAAMKPMIEDTFPDYDESTPGMRNIVKQQSFFNPPSQNFHNFSQQNIPQQPVSHQLGNNNYENYPPFSSNNEIIPSYPSYPNNYTYINNPNPLYNLGQLPIQNIPHRPAYNNLSSNIQYTPTPSQYSYYNFPVINNPLNTKFVQTPSNGPYAHIYSPTQPIGFRPQVNNSTINFTPQQHWPYPRGNINLNYSTNTNSNHNPFLMRTTLNPFTPRFRSQPFPKPSLSNNPFTTSF